MAILPAHLRQVEVFKDATDDDLSYFLRHSITRSIEEGGFFFFQGDPADYLYVLTSGQVNCSRATPRGSK